ncbi:hypothetical protein, partial [Burkholderia cepacia]|uniref:hypothetical protein n=1 Tax=Burkholderia cepacia TaxID=292 RepID=UPI002ABDB17B
GWVAALYPAFLQPVLPLLAPMKSADSCLIPPTSSRLYDQFRLGESRSYLVRHHTQNACATFQQSPPAKR